MVNTMNCKYCDNPIPIGVENCPFCGGACPNNNPRPLAPKPPSASVPQQDWRSDSSKDAVSPKSLTIYRVLAFFFGALGVHNFWCGRKTIAWIQMGVTIGSAALFSTMQHPYEGGSFGPIVWIWAVVEMFVVKHDGCSRLMK